jgi:hypothetical protein
MSALRFLVIVSYPQVRFRGVDGSVQVLQSQTHVARFASRLMADRHSVKARCEPGVSVNVIDREAVPSSFSKVMLRKAG